jgi:hypothetical protein
VRAGRLQGLLSWGANRFTLPGSLARSGTGSNLFVVSGTHRHLAARRLQPSHQRPQRPDTVTIKNSHTWLVGRTAQHIGRIGADRPRTLVRQGHHQEQDAVHAPELVSGHHQTEQGMGRSRYPHLAGQHGAQMLQSVGVTPGTGKTHLAIGLGIRACQAGHRVLFATASQWVDRLAEAHHNGRLQTELTRLSRYPLLVIDEVGYIPFEPEAANLFFQLVSSRYERASLIVTSNKAFGRWGEVFGDDVVAAAMIDRLVHHADIVALKGDSYRLRNRDLGRVPTDPTDPTDPTETE